MKPFKSYIYLWAALCSLTAAGAHAQDFQWHDPLEASSQVINGRAWDAEIGHSYHRLPQRAKDQLRPYAWDMAVQSAGLSIAFRTTSPTIQVRYTVTDELGKWGMPATGASGLDLYAEDVNGTTRWCAGQMMLGDTCRYTYSGLTYTGDPAQGYEFRLYLPLQNQVTSLQIGTQQGYDFRFVPTPTERPIVVYGTSIAQGCCASRPGMAWTNIVERESGHTLVNLGLAGQGQLDAALFSLLNEVDAKLYIIDCMPNMNGSLIPEIYPRLTAGVKQLRASHPTVPILLVEHSGYANEATCAEAERSYRRSNAELRRAYQDLQAEGISGLHYLTRDQIGLTQEDMVEGVHPHEIGMRKYADAYLQQIRRILGEDIPSLFTPCRQQRDSYNWLQRHEEVLSLNQAEQPDIVLIGNSITHYWAGTPTARDARGVKSWNRLFKGHTVRNMGFGWDRIENALWRIYHGELDGYQARKVFLLMGTNNLDRNTDEEIVSGILTLVQAVRSHQPQARIYVCGILPRAWNETRVSTVNDLLQRRLIGADATYVDMTPEVVQPNGKVIDSLFIDGLHPNEEGYERFAKMLEEAVKE
jgi:lysophospholipase L1-like esterase